MHKKIILIIFICLFIFPNKVIAVNEETVYVNSQFQFREAYNNKEIKKIILEKDIDVNLAVHERTTSLIIDGQGNKLDLGMNLALPIGKSKLGEIFSLENIRIANYSNKSLSKEDGYFKSTNIENMASWIFKFRNIKTEISHASENGKVMSKLINAPSSLIIFEESIDLHTRSYLVSGGTILIKDGCSFTGKQIDTGNHAFYFNNSKVSENLTESTGGIVDKDKSFIVEDNVSLNMRMENSKYGTVINPHIGKFELGNNVNWTIEGYPTFFKVKSISPIEKLHFGENCNLNIKSGENTSIITIEKDNCSIEFGEKSDIDINSTSNIISSNLISLKGNNNHILFRNPKEVNLNSKNNDIFYIEDGNYIKFENNNLESWNKGNNTESYDFYEEGISELIFKTTNKNGILVESDYDELNNYFNKNNISRLKITKGLLKETKIEYINQNDDLIGERLILDYNTDNIFAGDNIPIPNKYLNDYIPDNYHLAENKELNGKIQLENIYFETGKGSNSIKIYIYGNKTDIELDYVNMKSNKLISSKKFTKSFGDLVDFRDDEYLKDIKDTYYFLNDEELYDGLMQPKKIAIDGKTKYIVYIGENKDFIELKEKNIQNIEEMSKKKILEINNTAGILDINKEKAINEILLLRNTTIENLYSSISSKEVDEIFEKYKEDLKKIEIEEENTFLPINPPVEVNHREVILIGGEKSISKEIEKELSEFNIKRISGSNRYDTSIEISEEYKNADTVIITSGEKFTDELTSTVLSSRLKAPILLTRERGISEKLINEVKRLKAKSVIIVGGENTVSKDIEKSLKDYNVKRIGGKDRYETAILVGEEVRKVSGNNSKGILVDGTNFPDAVVMCSIASKEGIPILLTEPRKLNENTENIIDKWKIDNIIIGGGESSISKNIENKLKEKISIKRISGINRYETSVNVAKTINGINNKFIIVNGENFPDAIVASSYAVQKNYPILLSRENLLPKIVKEYLNK